MRKRKQDKNSMMKEIVKEIQWVKFLIAVKYTIKCMIASGIIGVILFMYECGINYLIALII